MPQTNHTILDREDPIPVKSWYESPILFWLSFPVLFVGVICKLLHWPFGNLLILSGSAVFMMRILLTFFKKSRNIYSWFYLIGSLSVIAWLVLYLIFEMHAPWIKLIFMALFALTGIGYLLKPSSKEGSLKDDASIEDEDENDDL